MFSIKKGHSFRKNKKKSTDAFRYISEIFSKKGAV
jgi:hypothetical protein